MAKPQRESRNPGIPFDPLQYVKRLEAVGFTRAQAEEQAETFLAIVQEQLVNKQDLKELEVNAAQRMKELEVKTTLEFELVRRDIKELEGKTIQGMKELEAKTTLEFELVRRDIKELEVKSNQQMKELEISFKTQSELLKRDLKIWFGGMLVTLVVVMSGIMVVITHLNGHS